LRAADRTEQDRIGLVGFVQRFIRQRRAVRVVRRAADMVLGDLKIISA